MNNDFARALCYESRETFGNIWLLDFEKGGLDQSEAAALANAIGGLTHIFISFVTTAAVTDDQNPCLNILPFDHYLNPSDLLCYCLKYVGTPRLNRAQRYNSTRDNSRQTEGCVSS